MESTGTPRNFACATTVNRSVIHDAPPPRNLPEHALLAAILERTMLDLTRKSVAVDYQTVNRDRNSKKAAFEWVFKDCANHEPFSFNFVCDELGFDPSSIRTALRVMYEAGKRPPRRRRITDSYAGYDLDRKAA